MSLVAAGVPFEIVPGVTAGVGVTAYAGIPVTHRAAASAVAFVTGHGDPESEPGHSRLDWAALADFPGTLVIYMGVTHLAAICRTLLKLGKPGDTPAAVIEWGTMAVAAHRESQPWQRSREVASRGLGAPPCSAGRRIGCRVCASELTWFERLPLFGQRIVVTRPRDEGIRVGRRARDARRRGAARTDGRGAADLRPGTTRCRDRPPRKLRLAGVHLGQRRAVLSRAAHGRGRDLRALGHLKLAAIGPATALALARFHLKADLVPETFRSEALAAALLQHAPGRQDSARTRRSRTDRPQGRARATGRCRPGCRLSQRRCDVRSPSRSSSGSRAGTIDWITLTSPAITARLHALLPQELRGSHGQRDSARQPEPGHDRGGAVRRLDVAVEAAEYTWEGLVRAIVEAGGTRTQCVIGTGISSRSRSIGLRLDRQTGRAVDTTSSAMS